MSTPDESSLHERVVALEAQVADLQRTLQRLQQNEVAPPDQPAAKESSPARPPVVLRAPKRKAKDDPARKERAALRMEDWISRIGIGLLLIGGL